MKQAMEGHVIYADTDFFIALLKPSDWLKKSTEKNPLRVSHLYL